MFRNTGISSIARNLFLIAIFSFLFTLLFAQSTDSIGSYHSIYYKGNAEIEINEQSILCQYNFVNVIDSFLYIQVNAGPIEAGRALITPDNILYINKLQKNYYDGDYTFFQHLLGLDIDFYAIQAIFNRFPVSVSEDVELSYHGEADFGEYSFFKILTCETEGFAIQLEIKKVTFNEVPKVSAPVPRNYDAIILRP